MTQEQVATFNLYWSRSPARTLVVVYEGSYEWPTARERHAMWLRSRGHNLADTGMHIGRLSAERARQILKIAHATLKKVESPGSV